MQNKPIFNGIAIESGRFFPLASMELNLLMQFSNSAYLFFIFNSFVFILIVFLFYLITLDIFGKFRFLLLFGIIVCLANPAFVIIILGICYPEKMLCLTLLLFIFTSYRILICKQYKFILLSLIVANYSIYLKEPAFIIIGGFGFLYLLFYRKSKLETLYCFLLVFSALVFVSIYIIYVIPNTQSFYGSPQINGFMNKVLIFFDSLKAVGSIHIWFISLLPLFVIFRILSYVKHKEFEEKTLFLDILLVCGFFYFLAYCILGLFRTYYFAPIYFVVVFSILYYIEIYRNFIVKIFLGFGVFLYLSNSLPQAIWQFSFIKSQGIALKQTLEFLSSFHGYKNIYFYALGRNITPYQDYFINHFGLYLNNIYKVKDFDILSNIQNDESWRYDEDSSLSIFNSNIISTPKSGDLVILNANSYKSSLQGENYELLFESDVIGLPNVSLKTTIKYLLHKFNIVTFRDENFFRMPINNYVHRIP